MPSAMEVYHEKQRAFVRGRGPFDVMADQLSELAKLLRDSDAILRHSFLRAEPGATLHDGPFEQSGTLYNAPTRDEIIQTVADLRNAELERDKAYEALSSIEKRYADYVPEDFDEHDYEDPY